MSALTKISKLFPTLLQLQTKTIPYIHINRVIDRETQPFPNLVPCMWIALIDKIPQNKNKIVVLINSEGGCLAQTQIIIKKIAHLASRNKAEVWTFGQEYALNAGFMILACGDRVYVDQTTVVGGIQVGQDKIFSGQLLKYVKNITYSTSPSYASEMHKSEVMDNDKKKEIVRVYSNFSAQMERNIRNLRGGRIRDDIDLKNYYIGEQALKAGLVDGVDRFYPVVSELAPKSNLKLLTDSDIVKTFRRIRQLNISD